MLLVELRRRRVCRFWQFTLREFMTVIALSTILAWWVSRYAEEDRQSLRERQALLAMGRSALAEDLHEHGTDMRRSFELDEHCEFSTDVVRRYLLAPLGFDESHVNVTRLKVERVMADDLFANISRLESLRELTIFMPSDRELYGIGILRSLRELKWIEIEASVDEIRVDFLRELATLTQVHEISLHVSYAPHPLSSGQVKAISGITNLTELWIADAVQAENWDLLVNMPRLETLSIGGEGVNNAALQALANLPRLRRLELGGASRVTIEGLNSLTKCESLQVIHEGHLGRSSQDALREFEAQGTSVRVDWNSMPWRWYRELDDE
jgi:hypothetical protein